MSLSNVYGAGDTVVIWFRRDLRLADHPALAEAVSRARAIVPLFVLDDELLAQAAPSRSWFLLGALRELDEALRARGSGLLLRRGSAVAVVPEVAARSRASVVLATRDVSPYSSRRDQAVSEALERDGRCLSLRPGLLLAEPESVHASRGKPYAVFTPFWRALRAADRRPLEPAPERISSPSIEPLTALPAVERPHADLPVPGESAARERLIRWVTSGLADYRDRRDALDGTGSSHLGVDLHFGTLSPRQVEAAALDSGQEAEAFVRQLAWREFYHHLLFHERRGDGPAPGPLMAAFRRESDDPAGVRAWWDGRTGIPVVDASMRQLAATGWLSNRARLVTASFLTRHLLMDYRIGERHFMRHLIDGDVANNRGGWRWTAGVGADPQPWFRIFNPVRQGQRFDPAGSWVRRWVPELADVKDRYIHAPWEAPMPPAAYPPPIIDLAEGRERALAAFKSATSGD